jgi:beta-xylosidase
MNIKAFYALLLCAGMTMPVMAAQTTRKAVSRQTRPLPSQTASFTNPVIWSDVPDMDVIRVGKDYYMVSTTMHLMPGGPIMHSRDLVNWQTVGYLFDKLTDSPKYNMEQGTVYGRGQWATSLKYHKGQFYALFSPNDHPGGETYILTARKAEGPWTLVSRLPHFHDATLFFDEDDRVYVFYGTGEMVELSHDLKRVVEGSHRQLFQRDSEEKGLLEGSRVIKHNGKYYLQMISWTQGHPRREVVYRADNIQGPYTKRVMLETEFAGYGGVGQGTIVDTPDGQWYALIFQDRGGVGRVPTLSPVSWRDGWPKVDIVPASMQIPLKGGKKSQIVNSDAFSSAKLSLDWQWNHNPVDKAWSLTERRGWLTLHTASVAPNIFLARNTLTTRMMGPQNEAIVRMDVSKMCDGDVAGFCAFQNDAALLSVVKEGNRKYIVATTDSVEMEAKDHKILADHRHEVYRQPLKQDIVYLKISADFRLHKDVATLAYSLDGKHWTEVLRNFKLVFDYRRFFMGTRFGLYNYATKQLGGAVAVDWFHFKVK